MSSGRWGAMAVASAVPWVVGLLLVSACGPGEPATSEAGAARSPSAATDAAGAGLELEGVVATAEDWRILAETVRRARARGLDTASIGEAVAGVGRSFTGTPYVPGTLEVPGPERTVVNFRGLDCVTFVETALATARLTRRPEVDPDDLPGLARAYAEVLTTLRYRDGIRDGYESRLHYFSEWLQDAEEKGFVRRLTPELASAFDAEPVTFMTSHPDAYRQLASPEVRSRIRAVEERISRTPRPYVPQAWIDQASSAIREGDVIAATSTVEGLDVAHTGIAVREGGSLRLLHAPLVGDSVHVSRRALARRISEIDGQDGILVARPLDFADSVGDRN